MTDAQGDDLQSQVTNLTARIESLESTSTPIDPTASDARIIARMQSNASWAIHYSTVRMTIGTFFITTCIAIMGLKWGEEEPLPAILAACAIWTVGMVLFSQFTDFTFKMRVAESEKRNRLLLTGEHPSTRTAAALRKADQPLFGLKVLTGAFIILVLVWSFPIWSSWIGPLLPEPPPPPPPPAAPANPDPAKPVSTVLLTR